MHITVFVFAPEFSHCFILKIMDALMAKTGLGIQVLIVCKWEEQWLKRACVAGLQGPNAGSHFD